MKGISKKCNRGVLALLAVATLALFSSCSKDDNKNNDDVNKILGNYTYSNDSNFKGVVDGETVYTDTFSEVGSATIIMNPNIDGSSNEILIKFTPSSGSGYSISAVYKDGGIYLGARSIIETKTITYKGERVSARMAAGLDFPIGKLVNNSINITGVLEGTISFTYNGEQLSGKYGGTDVYVFTK